MTITCQRGQSMTEYMVVLGVTGMALLAATTDVGELFDNVHRSYAAQSTEMNKVQMYNSQKIRFNENPNGDGGDFDDGDTPPPFNSEQPNSDEQLPYIEWVYDADGQLLGQMDENTLLDDEGNIIAWCKRTDTGDCVFQDADGNIIFPGATSNRKWVDEDGNELPLVALTSGGKVYGFVYQYQGRFYSARDRSLLNPQPTGFSAEPMRRVQSFDAQGIPQTEGYELGGALYSHQATLAVPDPGKAVDAEAKELVSVINPPVGGNWQGYSPCLVMPRGWSNGLSNGSLHDPLISSVWVDKFNSPSMRLGSASVGGFIDSTAADCGGVRSVTYDSLSGEWSLTR